jgi:hypothetical protein
MVSLLRTGAPIILGRCPSVSAHENESMLRTYLVCRKERERERERERGQTARGNSRQCTNNSDPINSTSELLLRQGSVIAPATYLRLADLPLTTAQQRSMGQNLPSDLYLMMMLQMPRIMRCRMEKDNNYRIKRCVRKRSWPN